jgi:hypothetical protein
MASAAVGVTLTEVRTRNELGLLDAQESDPAARTAALMTRIRVRVRIMTRKSWNRNYNVVWLSDRSPVWIRLSRKASTTRDTKGHEGFVGEYFLRGPSCSSWLMHSQTDPPPLRPRVGRMGRNDKIEAWETVPDPPSGCWRRISTARCSTLNFIFLTAICRRCGGRMRRGLRLFWSPDGGTSLPCPSRSSLPSTCG